MDNMFILFIPFGSKHSLRRYGEPPSHHTPVTLPKKVLGSMGINCHISQYTTNINELSSHYIFNGILFRIPMGINSSCHTGALEHHFFFHIYTYIYIYIYIYVGNFIIPTDELICFRGVAQPPTRALRLEALRPGHWAWTQGRFFLF